MHCCNPTASFLKPLEGKRKVTINLIKGNNVRSKEKSGILPRVSLPTSFVGKGHGVWSLEGPSWSSGPVTQLCHHEDTVQGAEVSLPYRTARRVHEKHSSGTRVLTGGLLGHLEGRSQDPPAAPPDPAPRRPSSRGRTCVWGGSSRDGGSKISATPSCQQLSELLLSYLFWTWQWYFYFLHWRGSEGK